MNQVSATFHGLNFWNPCGELSLLAFGMSAPLAMQGSFDFAVLALINAACWFALRNRPV
jgi:hypothetical protein